MTAQNTEVYVWGCGEDGSLGLGSLDLARIRFLRFSRSSAIFSYVYISLSCAGLGERCLK